MKKEKIELVIIGAVLVALIIFVTYTGYQYKVKENNKNNANNLPYGENNIYYNSKGEIEVIDNNKQDENDKNETSNNQSIDENLNTKTNNNDNTREDNVKDNKENVTNIENKNEENKKSDNEVVTSPKEEKISEAEFVSYFSLLDQEMETYKDEKNETFRDKAKNTFITVVDFLFYDKEIKGHTFKDLTLSAKLKVLKVAASIDNKIDKYFPNYKESIKKTFTNIKGKIASLYLETTNTLCTKMGESACNEARNDFNTMKKSFGYTWDLIKDVSSMSYSKLKVILSEWYQSIKED